MTPPLSTIVETNAGALYPHSIDLEAIRALHRPLVSERSPSYADGNMAAAYACLQMWRLTHFVGFPITPSTKWLETIAAVVGSGKVGKKRVKLLEAEHAVADYMAGAAAASRDLIVATATSSVGLDHMTESTRSLGASGLGNALLINVYRATANYPLCIEGDPSDTLAHRDDGFIQICSRGVQQIYDTILQAPCLGMHPEVMTPVMPGYFGIKDSHRSSRLFLEPDDAVNTFQDRWLSPSSFPGLINGDTAFGNCVTSKYFQRFKCDQRTRMERAFDILPTIGADFQTTFGRPGLEFFERLRWPKDDVVDLAVVGMGPDIGTAAAIAHDAERELHLCIGVIAVRLLTPFPSHAYAELFRKTKVLLVLNQAHHSGPGHLGLDFAHACYGLEKPPVIVNGFAGLGGAAVSDESWLTMMREARKAMQNHQGTIVWQN